MHVANALTGLVTVWWRSAGARWAGACGVCLEAVRPVGSGAASVRYAVAGSDHGSARPSALIWRGVWRRHLGVYALAVRIFDVLFQVTCGPIASVLLPHGEGGRRCAQFRERFLSVLGSVALWPPIYVCAALYAGVGVNLVFGENGPQLFLICNGLWNGGRCRRGVVHPPAFMALGKAQFEFVCGADLFGAVGFGLCSSAPVGAYFAMVLWVGRSAVVWPCS